MVEICAYLVNISSPNSLGRVYLLLPLILFGHVTCLGKWDICMFQAEVIERTCSREMSAPRRKINAKDRCYSEPTH